MRGSRQLAGIVRALRPHQWVKNLLVFVPLLAAHRAREADLALRATVAFAAFSLCASSAYVLNDLLDLEHDRAHPTRRKRPFAAGVLAPATGWELAPALLIAAFAVAWLAATELVGLLAAYFLGAVAYSLHVKRVPILDVIVLAGLYTVRMYGGAAAVGVPVSSWLAMFAMFLFLSLALVKRTQELRQHAPHEPATPGRAYVDADLPQLSALGAASGTISVLVLALYVSSDRVERLYAHPPRLWLLCPLALFWIGRLWFLANRGRLDDDPVVFTLKDPVSWAVLLGAAAVVVAAR